MNHVRVLGWSVLTVLIAVGASCGTAPAAPNDRIWDPNDTVTVACSGSHCACEDGRLGQSQCTDGGQEVCDCASCPAFSPSKKAFSFTPCGGEPFGTWRLRKLNTDGIALQLSKQNFDGTVTSAGQCETEISQPAGVPDLRLDLRNGGGMDVHSAGVTATMKLVESCLSAKVGARCDRLDLGFGTCTTGDCAICSCSFGTRPGDQHGSWSRTANTLTLDVDTFGASTTSFAYCVHDDELELADESHAVFTYERVQGGGKPTACQNRMAAQCTAGTGCHVGVCVGGTQCTTAQVESNCTNRQGCTWDTTQCSGTAPTSCMLADFDVVPGCQFVGVLSKCSGKPTGCDQKATEALCKATTGCAATAGCVGNGSFNCAMYTGACSLCDDIPGCTCGMGGGCSGTPTCEMQPTQSACGRLTGCSWSTFLCQGTPTPCEMLSVTQCTTIEGCQIDGAM